MLNLRTFGRIRNNRRPNQERSENLPRTLPKKGSREKDLLAEIKEILSGLQDLGYLSFRRIHCMPVLRSAGIFSVNKDMRGMEDLQVYLCGGRTLYFELKSSIGKQSPHQKARERELVSFGHQYFVVRDIKEFLNILRQFGINFY